ncbi:hypothetical protein [Microtetraspora sp. NBRC 13810]|uniref:hypothetical protein n=1 Tax=Microtetraspora sp. NBRC 13810 TaxID=3030990 RepID=UPI0025548D0E|nr:hypothetical protein [Microtetraspora sp. NBRC 13810]
MTDVIAGFRLGGRGRLGELGTWSEATAPDGRAAGALRFDARLVADREAVRRLASAVSADRRLTQGGLTGLLPIADLVAAGDEVWLLTGRPAGPTVTDLLNSAAGSIPDAGSAAAVLVETAQTLLAVHAAGLAHGALQPGTVVAGEDGAALLAERGLAEALRGLPPAPERDVAAWASLARGLAATWAGDAGAAAVLLDQVASTALTHGLAAARDVLLAGRDRLPGGFIGRERLADAVRVWRQGLPTPVATPYPTGHDEGEIVTLLHVPTPGSGTFPASTATPPTTPGSGSPGTGYPGGGGHAAHPGDGGFGAGHAAYPGDRGSGAAGTHPAEGDHRSTAHPGGDEVRFGPGVPTGSTAEDIWRSGREQATPAARDRRLRRAAARRRRRTVLSAVVFALVVAGALLAWLLRDTGPALAVQKVDVTAPKKVQGCDSTVTINGVITTNGGGGEIRYAWVRSDRKQPIEQTETVGDGTTHQVSLKWTVKGEGSFKGTATLRVLSPAPASGKRVEDKATFTYRCR